MLAKLQFDRNTYDIIDVPEFVIDFYMKDNSVFNDRLYSWLRAKGVPYYTERGYSYARDEIIEWLNSNILKDTGETAKIIALDKLDPSDDALPLLFF